MSGKKKKETRQQFRTPDIGGEHYDGFMGPLRLQVYLPFLLRRFPFIKAI